MLLRSRECLNYGHTLGHAVEALAGYGTFSHGAAVAEGMRFAARLGVALADTPLDFVRMQDELLDDLGLPALGWAADPADMLDAMKRDKKARGGKVRFVLPRDVGDWELVAGAGPKEGRKLAEKSADSRPPVRFSEFYPRGIILF